MTEFQRSSTRKGKAGHTRWVRVSHWIVTVSFLTLAFTGVVILMAHPRLYWGEVGNDLTPALVELPISRNYRHGGWENRAPDQREPDLRHFQQERLGPEPALSGGLVPRAGRRVLFADGGFHRPFSASHCAPPGGAHDRPILA
jgi:hypothetical protein